MNHNRDIDYNIWAIQRSTRTSFKSFVKLHNYLRTKSKFYYFWHANKLSSVMHQTILALFVMGVTYYTFNSYQQYVFWLCVPVSLRATCRCWGICGLFDTVMI